MADSRAMMDAMQVRAASIAMGRDTAPSSNVDDLKSKDVEQAIRFLINKYEKENEPQFWGMVQKWFEHDMNYLGIQHMGSIQNIIDGTVPERSEDEDDNFVHNKYRETIDIEISIDGKIPVEVEFSPVNKDIESTTTSEVANQIWSVARDQVGWERLQQQIARNRLMYGGAFVRTGSRADRRFGTKDVPQLKPAQFPVGPANLVCPQCNYTHPVNSAPAEPLRCAHCEQGTLQLQPPQMGHRMEPTGESASVPLRRVFADVVPNYEVKIPLNTLAGVETAHYLICDRNLPTEVAASLFPSEMPLQEKEGRAPKTRTRKTGSQLSRSPSLSGHHQGRQRKHPNTGNGIVWNHQRRPDESKGNLA